MRYTGEPMARSHRHAFTFAIEREIEDENGERTVDEFEFLVGVRLRGGDVDVLSIEGEFGEIPPAEFEAGLSQEERDSLYESACETA